jgi:hypothetical protein
MAPKAPKQCAKIKKDLYHWPERAFTHLCIAPRRFWIVGRRKIACQGLTEGLK